MKVSEFKKRSLTLLCALAVFSLCLNGCIEFEKPRISEFYGQSNAFVADEFRWGIGEMPHTIDPAKAALPAEMQLVRALSEGLTDWNPSTLEAVPAVAAKWEASDDFRVWTFYLRPNAMWTSGKKVTAEDFSRSWRRLVRSDVQSPHKELMANVVGASAISNVNTPGSVYKNANSNSKTTDAKFELDVQPDNLRQTSKTTRENQVKDEKPKTENQEIKFGVEAVDDLTLRVALVNSDKDFPKLIAHSAFHPVASEEDEFENAENWKRNETNGAFRLAAIDKNQLILERSANYWNAAAVKLKRVHLVAAKDAESLLTMYQNGALDAVTNVRFEPLALKLLASYRDFARTTFNAVTFYEFKGARAPFADRRVREALSIALDRVQLSNDELDGATIPASGFWPQASNQDVKFDAARARKLLADAGFPSGASFPAVRLLINRNDQQNRIAKAVAAQWRKNLNIETEIVVSSLNDIDDPRITADFDLVRRVVVFPTPDETINLQMMFKRDTLNPSDLVLGQANAENDLTQSETSVHSSVPKTSSNKKTVGENQKNQKSDVTTESSENNSGESSQSVATLSGSSPEKEKSIAEAAESKSQMTTRFLTETEMRAELPLIPLYFSASSALVKPYVKGFDLNLLDAPMLKNVYLENN